MTKKEIKAWLEDKSKRNLKKICNNFELTLPKDVKTNKDIVAHIIANIDHSDLCELQEDEPVKKTMGQKFRTHDGVELTLWENTVYTGIKLFKYGIVFGLGCVFMSKVGKVGTIESGDENQDETADDMTV